ncbi:MAG: TSUP family transporter [Flavobacteriales bacterium]|jgi:uncharacterized membrane protein YfcA
MEFVLIILVALAGAFLSFFSGFGLGTLLLPAFLVVFPPPVAIAATAVVHMLNNLFKLFLVGRYAQRQVLAAFGITSVMGAWLGAQGMETLAASDTRYAWSLGALHGTVAPVNLVVGLLIILFALLESWKRFEQLVVPRKWFPVGGFVSGFFGGLSGHQGALRSAFLMKSGMNKEAFMGNRVVLACMVDLTRIAVYAGMIRTGWKDMNPAMVLLATLAAFTGAWFGNTYMKKVELGFINRIVIISLLLFGAAMSLGLV